MHMYMLYNMYMLLYVLFVCTRGTVLSLRSVYVDYVTRRVTVLRKSEPNVQGHVMYALIRLRKFSPSVEPDRWPTGLGAAGPRQLRGQVQAGGEEGDGRGDGGVQVWQEEVIAASRIYTI